MPVGFVCPQCDALTELGASRCPSCGAGLGWNGVSAASGGFSAVGNGGGPGRAPARAERNGEDADNVDKVANVARRANMASSSAMKPCPTCGTAVPVDDRFCGKCGARLGDEASAAGSAAPPGKTLYFSG